MVSSIDLASSKLMLSLIYWMYTSDKNQSKLHESNSDVIWSFDNTKFPNIDELLNIEICDTINISLMDSVYA